MEIIIIYMRRQWGLHTSSVMALFLLIVLKYYNILINIADREGDILKKVEYHPRRLYKEVND